MNFTKNNTIAEIVASDYRTAQIFKKHGIDFCCKGHRSVRNACKENTLSPEDLLLELKDVINEEKDNTIDFSSWDIDLLADYIEKNHHRYIQKKSPEIRTYLEKIARVHGDNHPELHEILKLFISATDDLTTHMRDEENIVFPVVRKMVNNEVDVKNINLDSSINIMMQEHNTEGARFRKIAELSDNYKPPQDACSTYHAAFAMLKEFETDLHKHIHLENNILFPRTLKLTKT